MRRPSTVLVAIGSELSIDDALPSTLSSWLQQRSHIINSSSNHSTMRDNQVLFKEALAAQIVVKSFGQADPSSDADDASLDDFISWLAADAWEILPPDTRAASYEHPFLVDDLHEDVLEATPLQFSDTLIAYGVIGDRDDALKLLRNTVDAFLQDACAAPAVGKQTRLAECEICDREIPLTYHHLIPRSVHNKVLKRGWHPAERLNAVAWLCRCVPVRFHSE